MPTTTQQGGIPTTQLGGPPIVQQGGQAPIKTQGHIVPVKPSISLPHTCMRTSPRLTEAQEKVKALRTELRRLKTFYNPTADNNNINVVVYNQDTQIYEDEELVYATELISDPNEPKAFRLHWKDRKLKNGGNQPLLKLRISVQEIHGCQFQD